MVGVYVSQASCHCDSAASPLGLAPGPELDQEYRHLHKPLPHRLHLAPGRELDQEYRGG